jgi:hypothetical protein
MKELYTEISNLITSSLEGLSKQKTAYLSSTLVWQSASRIMRENISRIEMERT